MNGSSEPFICVRLDGKEKIVSSYSEACAFYWELDPPHTKHMPYGWLDDCPFCGERPEYRPSTPNPNHPIVTWPEMVMCRPCGICFRTEKGVNAVEKWNNRNRKCTDDLKWREAFSGYMHSDRDLVMNGSPKEIINKVMGYLRETDCRWREEIEKYLPQIGMMSFLGPQCTMKWLMERVDIKEPDKTLADKIKGA